MKTLKKLFVFALALAMLSCLALTAFAEEDTYTITINNDKTGHTYGAYQVFAGTLSNGKLTGITWGDGVTLTGEDTLKVGETELDAAGWADLLAAEEYDSDLLKAFADAISAKLADATATSGEPADGKYTISGLDAGYYLVKDDAAVSGEDSATRYILKVTNDTEVSPKSSTPSVDKQVLDTNDSNSAVDGEEHWNETADHDIGDHVSFRLIGTLPSTYADYKSYKYIFHDTMSAGLTLDVDSITAKVVTGEGTEEDPYETVEEITLTKGTDYKVVTDTDDDCTFHVVFSNLKTVEGLTADHKIMVEYTAELNENAVIGVDGNPNEVKLQFSNDPNYEKSGEPGDDDDDEPTGETPPDKVIVFTYELDVNKVDEKNEALPGAGFTLYKKIDGDWKAIKFAPYYGPDKTDGEVLYYVVAEYVDNYDETSKECELSAADMTEFKFAGLDDGEYKLVESTVPAGYNQAADIEFTITATHDDTKEELVEVKFGEDDKVITDGQDTDLGIGTTDVVNHSGLELPETGGIGTTIFYIVGGLLVVSAGVLLITKSRMKSKG